MNFNDTAATGQIRFTKEVKMIFENVFANSLSLGVVHGISLWTFESWRC